MLTDAVPVLFTAEPRYGKEVLGKKVQIQSSDGKRWRTATLSAYHGGYLRHTGKSLCALLTTHRLGSACVCSSRPSMHPSLITKLTHPALPACVPVCCIFVLACLPCPYHSYV